MKVRINKEIFLDVCVNGYKEIEVIAPEYIDLYYFGFSQGGIPKEGYRKWCIGNKRCQFCQKLLEEDER